MTVEDPIEFLHKHKSCLVNQREVGEDTHSFQNALKHVLRQDPDIILVGEMRDLETISVALTAAETGHLVFATLHTAGRRADHRPRHRRLPAAPAAAGPRAARRRAAGRRLPDAVQDRRRPGPGRRHRGARRDAGDPQPDPRGQDAPDLLGAAGRREARHAHDGPAPRRAGEGRPHHATRPASRSATTSRTSTGSAAGDDEEDAMATHYSSTRSATAPASWSPAA